ncbi:MAG: GNAT family N-acetyltransferase, partial [Acidimicrobiia bacterium]
RPPDLPEGWHLRAVTGEAEADNRRSASHAAFESTMDPAMHLQRYVDFMRSSSYVAEHDLVAVAPEGIIASFMVWWADEASGVAQIEPFGTHPAFHRQGSGRALLYHGLAQMKEAGMTLCRVCTDDDRPATGFYEGVGFEDVRRLRWWARRDVT